MSNRMKKIGSIGLLVAMMLLCFLPSCGKKGGGQNAAFVERIQPLNEALLPLLDSYTSGVVAAGEPIVVRFKSPETMKVKFGETIPAKAFQFIPALKGSAYWVDENTVGFKYDNIDKEQNYICKFHVSDFVDCGSDQTLEFGFGVRRQNFSLVAQQPVCNSNETMDYNLRIAFAVPVDQDDAVKLFDDAFRNSHPVEITYSGNNIYDFLVQNFERKNENYDVHVVLNGKEVDSKAKMERDLTIYAKNVFKPVGFDVDQTSDHATLLFSQPLNESQNLTGFITTPRNRAMSIGMSWTN